MEYKVGDKKLNASTFLSFVNQVWQGDYDIERTKEALSKTLNITDYDDKVLVGCLRILSDGYYFGTILYFGSQPGVEGFYEKNGCQKGLQSYTIEKKRQ